MTQIQNKQMKRSLTCLAFMTPTTMYLTTSTQRTSLASTTNLTSKIMKTPIFSSTAFLITTLPTESYILRLPMLMTRLRKKQPWMCPLMFLNGTFPMTWPNTSAITFLKKNAMDATTHGQRKPSRLTIAQSIASIVITTLAKHFDALRTGHDAPSLPINVLR